MLQMHWTPDQRRCAAHGVTKYAVAFALAIVSSAASADTINVVTSFPKELTGAYKAAFEKKYPGDKLEILNKNTAAARRTG